MGAAQKSLNEILGRKEIALLLLIDFSKAFDMVDHDILLEKLAHYDIRGMAYQWLKSYLYNRKQFVSINGKNSKINPFKYGVPQGSILGPLLFIIYINDIPNIQQATKFILYADDANIIIHGKTMHKIEMKFNILSKNLVNWVSANGLSLNVRKTNYMIFTNMRRNPDNLNLKVNAMPVEERSTCKFLGVLIDNKLTWKHHIAAVAKKLNQNAGILFKVKGLFPQKVMKTLYHSFIQSTLNYCTIIWGLGCKSSLNSIFVAQKRAVRVISPGFVNYWYDKKTGQIPSHTKMYFQELELHTIYSLVLLNILVFMQKIQLHRAPQSILDKFSLTDFQIPNTSYCNFEVPQTRLKCQTNSIFHKGPLLFNSVLQEISTETCEDNETQATNESIALNLRNTNLNPFKRAIKKYISKIQGTGDSEEWESINFRLYKGSRSSKRLKSSYIKRNDIGTCSSQPEEKIQCPKYAKITFLALSNLNKPRTHWKFVEGKTVTFLSTSRKN